MAVVSLAGTAAAHYDGDHAVTSLHLLPCKQRSVDRAFKPLIVRTPMEIIFAVFNCLSEPLVVLGLFVWFVWKLAHPKSPPSAAVHQPPSLELFDNFDELIHTWQSEGRLAPDVAAPILELIQQERTVALSSLVPMELPPATALDVGTSAAPSPVVSTPIHSAANPLAEAAVADHSETQSAEKPAPASVFVQAQPETQLAEPPTPKRPVSERFWEALLAYRTRQTLLYVGTLLLVSSALILVVFNWRNFSPLVQFALLAGVCGGLWGSGTWMTRRPDLASAGAGLQSVAGALTPIVAFALSRPGLLDLGLRPGWLLAACISLPIYLVAAWHQRKIFFAVASCLTAVSAVLVAVSFVGTDWLPLALVGLLILYVPLSAWLRRSAPELAAAPFWIAYGGVPLAIVSAVALNMDQAAPSMYLAATLWASVGFYVVTLWLDRQPTLLLYTTAGLSVLVPTALLSTAAANGVATNWLPSIAVMALLSYLPLVYILRKRGLERIALVPSRIAHIGVPLACISFLQFWIYVDTSAASLTTLWTTAAFYLLATSLERRALWSWISAVLLPIALAIQLLNVEFFPTPWLPIPLLGLFVSYLPFAHWLRRQASNLAGGPYSVAYIGMPITLLSATVGLVVSNNMTVLATTLWIGVGCYVLALILEEQFNRVNLATINGWIVAFLAPLALLVTLAAMQSNITNYGLALALLAWLYLVLGLAGEHRWLRYAQPLYVTTIGLILGTLIISATSIVTARWTLPIVMVMSLQATVATHRRYFGWLNTVYREILAVSGLTLVDILAPIWLSLTLRLLPLSTAQQALLIMPLAAVYFVGAFLWPGRLRPSYDQAMQTLGVALSFFTLIGTQLHPQTSVQGMALFAAIWTLQALLRRHPGWATFALGSAAITAMLYLEQLGSVTLTSWMLLGLFFSAAYLLMGTLLRHTTLRYWTWPAIGWGSISTLITVCTIGFAIVERPGVLASDVIMMLTLALLIVALTILWRQALLGYIGAVLFTLTTLLAAQRGFFTGWQPTLADISYTILGLMVAFMLLGQMIRQFGRSSKDRLEYAYPYEIVGFALLAIAPILAVSNPVHTLLVWIAITLLCVIAAWLYALPWLIAIAMLASDMALLSSRTWLVPSQYAEGASALLLAATWVQALVGLWAWKRAQSAAAPAARTIALSGFGAAFVSGTGAFWLTQAASGWLAIVAFGLATLITIIAFVEQRESLAWGSLVLLALGLIHLHIFFGLSALWSIGWGVAESFALCLVGWLLEKWPWSRVWYKPLLWAPLAATFGLTGMLLAIAPLSGEWQTLSFGLATLGLLLATLAVRMRSVEYVYGAGAALVGAGLCQLVYLGFRQPQWYVIPSGIYLLALAEGLRRVQRERVLAQWVEVAATVMLLGTTLGQALRTEDLSKFVFTLWLCCEALVLLGYGTLRQLRIPFFGGAFFLVIAVIWLSIDPIRATNKWVLLGLLGLLLVGVYVLLERRQEHLVRMGKRWADHIEGWS